MIFMEPWFGEVEVDGTYYGRAERTRDQFTSDGPMNRSEGLNSKELYAKYTVFVCGFCDGVDCSNLPLNISDPNFPFG